MKLKEQYVAGDDSGDDIRYDRPIYEEDAQMQEEQKKQAKILEDAENADVNKVDLKDADNEE